MKKSDIALLKKIDSEVLLLSHAASLLGWDQETYIPSGAVDERSRQLSLLSSIVHERLTSKSVKSVFSGAGRFDDIEFSSETGELDKAFVRKFFDTYRKQALLPASLVSELSRQASVTQHLWAKARADNNYPLFAGEFSKMLSLVKEKAECLGYEKTPYDALLDEYEKGMTSSALEEIFSVVEMRTGNLLEKIVAEKQVDNSLFHGQFSIDRQEKLGRKVLDWLGYDKERGRMDVSAHPFTTTLGFSDVRITTRYREDYFLSGLYSIIHECGHALYEQGFGDQVKDSSLAEGTSLGIHESQSRFWENVIGRSDGFARFIWPHFAGLFPEAVRGKTADDYFRGVNRVEPSLIRINADEVTYNLHIIMRYRLEKSLIEEDISVSDLPEAWNSMSGKLLKVKPSADSEGVLQDVHWSFGAMGYFPTYLLGNLYSAQFVSVMEKETGSTEKLSAEGNFGVILTWLRENIHKSGSIFTPDELLFRVTGKSLVPGYFLDYLDRKYSQVYGF
ncbi:MAG: carboxypeptidase M32 [Spirochaetia bacterium]|jgi:carboxypeptidase Taq|nr:carboxypeptidase M32 [Spirochaetia bacterium]